MKSHEFINEAEALPSVKTPTPEQLANKHNVSIEQINKQIEMGIKVELEHTTDRKTAREIALDHVLELVDYYTRLDKMENEGGVNETFSDSEKGDLVKITPNGVKVRGSMQYLGVGDWVEIRETGFQKKIIHLSKHSIRLEDGKYYSLAKLKYPMD